MTIGANLRLIYIYIMAAHPIPRVRPPNVVYPRAAKMHANAPTVPHHPTSLAVTRENELPHCYVIIRSTLSVDSIMAFIAVGSHIEAENS